MNAQASPTILEQAEGASPVMAQFFEAKAKQPDALIFFRMGDFYELFFEDAAKAAAALGITLTQRGNQVGFSGGNIMRMDVSYFDLSGGADREMPMMQSQDYETGANPRLALPANRIGPRDTIPAAPSGSTLRVSLTLYESNGGKVLWTATASCSVRSSAAMQAGLSIVNHIFDNADANRVADAGCPL